MFTSFSLHSDVELLPSHVDFADRVGLIVNNVGPAPVGSRRPELSVELRYPQVTFPLCRPV